MDMGQPEDSGALRTAGSPSSGAETGVCGGSWTPAREGPTLIRRECIDSFHSGVGELDGHQTEGQQDL